MLYASSEGDAVLIAGSVTEALEMIVRIPRYCENISADLDEDQLRAEVDAADEEAREEFAPNSTRSVPRCSPDSHFPTAR